MSDTLIHLQGSQAPLNMHIVAVLSDSLIHLQGSQASNQKIRSKCSQRTSYMNYLYYPYES